MVAARRLPRVLADRRHRLQLDPRLGAGRRGVAPGDERPVPRVEPGLGPRRRVPLLPVGPLVHAPARVVRVELPRRPRDRHLRAGPAEGRAASPAAGERRGDGGGGRRRRGRGRGRRGRRRVGRRRRRGADPHRVRRPRAAGGAAARHVRQLRGAERRQRPGVLHPHRRAVLRARRRRPDRGADLLVRGSRDRDAGRERRRLRGVRRPREGARRHRGAFPVAQRLGRRGPGHRLHGGADGGPGAGRGVGADLRRGVAALPRLLLRRQHARLRLGGPARAVPPVARARRPPVGPELRDRRDGGGAERQPRLYRRRRLGDPGSAPGGPAGGGVRARPRRRALPAGRDLRGAQRGAALPGAADRGRGGRRRRRLRARHRRRGARGRRQPLPPAAAQGGPPGAADPEHGAGVSRRRGRGARGDHPAHHQRDQPALPRRGDREPDEGRRGDGGAGRLPAHPRHGRRRHPGVHQVLLRPDPEGRPDHRRARQRGRQRVGDAHPAPEPRAPRHRLLADGGEHRDLSHDGVHRPPRVHPRRGLRLGRRHLPRPLQGGGPGAAHREALVGRRHRHHQPRAPHRRR